jgi:energy-coupling factor transporter ATP-binding protein EcfA2
MQPRHLVLDEPTARLDPAGTDLVSRALRRLAAAGASILLAEHKTDLLDGLAERIVVLDAGRIAMAGPAARILADPRLPELGVAAPARVRLEGRLAADGLDTPVIRAVLDGQGTAEAVEP